jgi:hypothetical protein
MRLLSLPLFLLLSVAIFGCSRPGAPAIPTSPPITQPELPKPPEPLDPTR